MCCLLGTKNMQVNVELPPVTEALRVLDVVEKKKTGIYKIIDVPVESFLVVSQQNNDGEVTINVIQNGFFGPPQRFPSDWASFMVLELPTGTKITLTV